jgi:hypothetical protein
VRALEDAGKRRKSWALWALMLEMKKLEENLPNLITAQ